MTGKIRESFSTQKNYRLALLTGVAALALTAVRPAHAYEYTFNNGVTIQFDNTIQYTLAARAASPDAALTSQVNNNDGDLNLQHGIISSRIDLLTKFDLSDNGYGIDVSADSFYDPIYNERTQQSASSFTNNAATQPADKYTSQTETEAGRNIELRNLFAYGSNTIDGVPVTLRVGRLVNIFGESLFFAGNGVAYGNAPVDALRAVSVPNTQAKDLFLPTGQALLTVQPTDAISVSAYYNFEWEPFNFIPVGDYFSTVDLLQEGGQRIIASPGNAFGAPGVYFYRTKDERGKDTGQFGIALHYDPPGGDYDLGLYALQYNDSQPQVYTSVAGGAPKFIPGFGVVPNALSIGNYRLVYPDGIQIYGVSGSTTIASSNYAGELSVRANEPLNSSVTLLPGQSANNSNHPAYAKGDTLHYQVSDIYFGPATSLWEGSSFLGELAGDNLMAITKNRDNFNHAYRHMALGFRGVFTADYFHVLPGLDVTVPVGLGWNFMGLAPDTPGFNNTGIDRGGDLTIGVSGTYLNVWNGGISYTRYISPPGRDPLADRDFVEVNVERTF